MGKGRFKKSAGDGPDNLPFEDFSIFSASMVSSNEVPPCDSERHLCPALNLIGKKLAKVWPC